MKIDSKKESPCNAYPYYMSLAIESKPDRGTISMLTCYARMCVGYSLTTNIVSYFFAFVKGEIVFLLIVRMGEKGLDKTGQIWYSVNVCDR